MPPTRATVTYKKKDGILSISDDSKYVFWTPATPAGASPTVTVPVKDITNLQQTPASAPKVALKVFVGEESYVFSFTHASNARKEQEAITDGLRNTIAATKASAAASLAPASTPAGGSTPAGQGGGADGQSAAMAIAKAVSSKAADEGWYDDAKLKGDFQLQRSLLSANPGLRTRFEQALHDKPESVSVSQFTNQFWSTRLHLLRAHAIEKAQKQGEYNVLPEIKFTRVAGKEGEADTKTLSITKEQIKLIFKQYPIVSEAYNENVPPLQTGEFWQRFFSSRLLKKLKGEKITQIDPPDPILDRYLDRRDNDQVAPMGQVPHFIDLEGNEQNHSQRKGNRPDETMRPSSFDKVPILRVLNNLSEKMMSHVVQEDLEAHAPVGQLEDQEYEQLRLRDLAMEDADNRVVLNIKEQRRLMGGEGEDDDLSAEARLYAKQDPNEVLSRLRVDLQPEKLGSDANGTLRLDRAIGFDPDDDSDDEDEAQANGVVNGEARSKAPKIGSSRAMQSATSTLLSSVKQRREANSSDPHSLSGLSQSTFDALTTTHNTTTEFLHYFWTLFLSGDSSRSSELAQLVSTLDRSLDRINAVGKAAEDERQAKVDGIKKQIQEYYQRTGKRRKFDFESIGGGKKVVDGMIRPTVGALEQASKAYRRVFEEQTREQSAAA